jgi:crotonobetainyl-CoA:carnitine CoA-transferase CaiB-like acyl-CoA transferase
MPPFVEGESAPFMVWNRNKRSIVIDLKSEAGKGQLLALIDGADVLIENFRPGTLDRLQLGWPSLQARNPRLIYAAVSGFGQSGPYRGRGRL